MRMLVKNKRQIYYSLNLGEQPVYARDGDGNIVYDTMPDGVSVPRVTGGKAQEYSEPAEAMVNIAFGAAAMRPSPFGFNYAGYTGVKEFDAKMVTARGEYPIGEGTLIWCHNAPGNTAPADISEADYFVIAAYSSLNETSYVLQKVQR